MASRACTHSDVREFDGLRTCLECGETRFRDEGHPDPAAAEEQEYLYTDLRCLERGRTIRLVLLEPGDYDDPVYCTLVLSGTRHSEYDAVSYTWATEDGDDTKSRTVYIDGSVLHVTQNCHSALQQLRHRELHRRIWIDAICINQRNVHERNHQVGLMDCIYREACRVHVCIQDSAYDYSDAMRWLSGIDDCWQTAQEPIKTLLARRYFSRVWVIQEILLAQALTLHVNKAQVELTDSALRWMNKITGITGLLRTRGYPWTQRGLEDCLRLSLTSHCSDPRDHVYAILSLLDTSVRDLIPVDYSLSIHQVYSNVVIAHITAYQKLDMYAYAAQVVAAQTMTVTEAFTIDQFHSFLQHNSDRQVGKVPEWPRTHLAKVHLGSEPDTSFSSRVQILPITVHSTQILPKLRIRAHRVDVCGVWAHKLSIDSLHRTYLDLLLEQRGRNLEEANSFRVEPDPSLLYRVPINPTSIVALQDLVQVTVELKGKKEFGTYAFGAGHGLGRSVRPALPGDCVFLLDGVAVHMLLRPFGPAQYSIISVCWWAPVAGASRDPEATEIIEVH